MINQCWLCEFRPIEAAKKPLCWGCYSLCRVKGLLDIFPTTDSGSTSRLRAIKKYGQSLLEDMEYLQSGRTTLATIGSRYSLTRERVRQLYSIFFGEKYTEAVRKKTSLRKERVQRDDYERNLFPNRHSRAKKSGPRYTGMIAEKLFLEKSESIGYVVEMARGGAVYDATVNGIPVDIKCGSAAVLCWKRGKQLYYHFGTRKKQREIVKYFPFYLIDQDLWYIIPSKELKGEAYFVPKYDIDYKGHHKYRDIQKYREAWHLLKGGENA